MADRLTQLQDAVNVQAENLTNSIGILQQAARPNHFAEATLERSQSNAYSQTLAEMGVILPPPTQAGATTIKAEDGDGEPNGTLDGPTTNGGSINGGSVGGDGGGDGGCLANGGGDLSNLNNLDLPDHGMMFAKLIAKTAKDIDVIIDSLPSRETEAELQEAHIRRLEEENKEEARKLEATIKQGEEMLELIKNALEDIAQNQMMMEQLEARTLSNFETTTATVVASTNNGTGTTAITDS